MRILWSANAPWCASGYGIQSKYLLPRFQALGHEVAVHAWYGLQGGMLNLNNITIYPQGIDTYGNDIVDAHAAHFQADIVVSLMDVWVLRDYGKKRMRWIPYMPIDSEPIPEATLHALQGAYRVCSYSRFGEKMLNDAGIRNTYIPHGVDTAIFAPQNKAEAKKAMGFAPDDFVIGMVAANKGMPSRKAFPENLQAVAILKERHPDVKIYLHTLANTGFGGIDFDALLRNLGFQKEQVKFCNQYKYMLGFSEEYMATAYNSLDVYLGASMSEGFGIPLVEAQACGVPVIATKFTSMPELVMSGWLAEIASRFWTPLNMWMVLPSVESILECLEQAYQHRGDTDLSQKARAGTLAYDWDNIVANGWAPFLAEIQGEIAPPVPLPMVVDEVAA